MAILSNDKLNDARVVRTRKNLRDAFCYVCTAKPLSDIMITEITDTAHINRKTFYLHYENINDLVDDVIINISDEICSGFIDDHSDKGLSDNILMIYKYIESHKDLMMTLLYSPDYIETSKKLKDTVLSDDYFDSFYNTNPLPAIIKGYFMVIFSIYQRWSIEKSQSDISTMPDTIEELADDCAHMLIHGTH